MVPRYGARRSHSPYSIQRGRHGGGHAVLLYGGCFLQYEAAGPGAAAGGLHEKMSNCGGGRFGACIGATKYVY